MAARYWQAPRKEPISPSESSLWELSFLPVPASARLCNQPLTMDSFLPAPTSVRLCSQRKLVRSLLPVLAMARPSGLTLAVLDGFHLQHRPLALPSHRIPMLGWLSHSHPSRPSFSPRHSHGCSNLLHHGLHITVVQLLAKPLGFPELQMGVFRSGGAACRATPA